MKRIIPQPQATTTLKPPIAVFRGTIVHQKEVEMGFPTYSKRRVLDDATVTIEQLRHQWEHIADVLSPAHEQDFDALMKAYDNFAHCLELDRNLDSREWVGIHRSSR